MRPAFLLCLVALLVQPMGFVHGQSENVKALIAVLETKTKPDRLEAMRKLGQLGRAAEPALAALGHELRSVDEQLSTRAALTMAQIGRASVPEFLNTLRDFRPAVRLRALHAIALMGPEAKETIPVLVGFLRDKEPAIRAQAAVILGEVGLGEDRAVKALGELLADGFANPRQVAEQALVRFGKTAVPGLKELLEDDRQAVRKEAARLLGRFGRDAKGAVPNLIAGLDDESAAMRAAAAEGLAGIGGEAQTALPRVLRGLKEEKDFTAQQSLFLAVSQIGHQNVPNLLDELRNINDEAGWAAPFVLAQFGPRTKDAVKPLVAMLNEKDSNIRLAAALALGQVGKEAMEAIPALTKATAYDTSATVRGAAAQSLVQIDPRQEKQLKGKLQAQVGQADQQLKQLEARLRKMDLMLAEPVANRKVYHHLLTDKTVQDQLDQVVSAHVFGALVKTGDIRKHRGRVRDVAMQMGPEAVPALARGTNLASQLGLGYC